MKMKVIGTMDGVTRFFRATQFFQDRIGLNWLLDSSRKLTESCYEITPSENVKHAEVILKSIAVAAGCHIEP